MIKLDQLNIHTPRYKFQTDTDLGPFICDWVIWLHVLEVMLTIISANSKHSLPQNTHPHCIPGGADVGNHGPLVRFWVIPVQEINQILKNIPAKYTFIHYHGKWRQSHYIKCIIWDKENWIPFGTVKSAAWWVWSRCLMTPNCIQETITCGHTNSSPPLWHGTAV